MIRSVGFPCSSAATVSAPGMCWGRGIHSMIWSRRTRFPFGRFNQGVFGTKHWRNQSKARYTASTKTSHDAGAVSQEVASKRRRFNRWTVTIFTCMCIGIIAERTSKHLPDVLYDILGVSSPSVLDVMKFKPFTLMSKESVSSSLDIFKLSPSIDSSRISDNPYEQSWGQGIWSVEFKQPQLQIARRYTPLPPIGTESGERPGSLSFLIRREARGEVSRYLHTLAPGADIEVRGSYLEYEMPEDIDQVIFLAGGTGIAPAMQVAQILQQRATAEHRNISMQILWACRSRDECRGGANQPSEISAPKSWLFGLWGSARSNKVEAAISNAEPGPLVKRLESMQADGASDSGLQIVTSFFVDEEGTFITKESIANSIATMSKAQGKRPPESSGKKLLLISGPDGFVAYTAGAKQLWRGIEYQGPIGGLLSRISHEGWEIRKL